MLFLNASDLPDASEVGQKIADTLTKEDDIFAYGFVNTLIIAAVVGAITFAIIKLMQHFLAKRLSGNMKIFYRLIYIIIIVIAVFVVLTTIKPLQKLGVGLLASSGVAAVVIGLAAQQTLGNVFSGISISTSKPFHVGDFIEILNTTPPISGIVKDIGLRHTTILEGSNKRIEIPNSVLDKEIVRVAHAHNPSNVTNFLDVSISYTSDLDLAINTLSSLVARHKDYVDTRTETDKANGAPIVTIRVMELGDYAIKLRAFVWTVDAVTGFAVMSDLLYAVKKEFDRLGIEIPYPYQNIILNQKDIRQNDPPDQTAPS